jgi:hypothetical protein
LKFSFAKECFESLKTVSRGRVLRVMIEKLNPTDSLAKTLFQMANAC